MNQQIVRSRILTVAGAVLVMGSLAGCERVRGTSAGSGESQIILEAGDVHVAGTSDLMADVQDLEILPNGTVWVLNSVEPLFLAFGPEGDVVRTHGRRGGGPEEFGAPAGFVIGGIGGEAWVFDSRRHTLVRVSTPGGERSEISLPPEELPRGSVIGGMNMLHNLVRTARLGDELILPRRATVPEAGIFSFWLSAWSADLLAFDPLPSSVRPVVGLGGVLGDPTPHVDLSTGGLPPFPLWYRLWAVCSDDEIRIYDHLRNELRGFTRDGTELEATALPPPRHTEVTPRQFARAAFDYAVVEMAGAVTPNIVEMPSADSARIIDGLVGRLDASPRQLANVLPRYVDYRCAEDGTQWIRPLDIDRGGLDGGPGWLRITPDGEIREVRFPERFDPYRFTAERIWGVQRDEWDVGSIAWIPTPQPQ